MIAGRVLPFLLFLTAPMVRQEIKNIDLTVVQQRTELRYPPAPPVNCEEAKVVLAVGMAQVSAAGTGLARSARV